MFANIICFKYIGKRMVQEDDVLPWSTEPPFLSALHATNNTTNPFGYKLGKSTENNKALLFFFGKETIQTFNRSIERGCVTAVQFILFNFADYSPSVAMKLKYMKWQNQRSETNKYVS